MEETISIRYSRRHKKVPVPYSYYDRKTLRSVKRYDPITVQIWISPKLRCNYARKACHIILAREAPLRPPIVSGTARLHCPSDESQKDVNYSTNS